MDKLLYVLIVYAVISVVNLAMYGADKSMAKRGARRIPERVLLGVSFCGGAVGGLLGMTLFRHKTKHWYFWLVNILGLLWQAGVAVLLAVLAL